MKNRMMLFIILCILLMIGICTYLAFKPNETKGSAFHQRSHIIKEPFHKTTTINEETPKATTQEMVLGVPIGKKVNLVISQSSQETNYYCIPACVQMILRHFNIEVDQDTLAQQMNTHPITGTEYVDTAITINTYLFQKGLAPDNEPGYHIQTIAMNDQNPQIVIDFAKRVKEDIDTNYPVLAAINTQTLYPQIAPANHMILITGYACHANSDEIAFYYAMDPYANVHDPIYGGAKIFTSEELIKAILLNEEPAYIW